jgi:hypothetical protein
MALNENKAAHKTFEKFNLVIDDQKDKISPAYINIRFKSNKEKNKKTQKFTSSKASKTQNLSTVSQFLHDECQSS